MILRVKPYKAQKVARNRAIMGCTCWLARCRLNYKIMEEPMGIYNFYIVFVRKKTFACLSIATLHSPNCFSFLNHCGELGEQHKCVLCRKSTINFDRNQKNFTKVVTERADEHDEVLLRQSTDNLHCCNVHCASILFSISNSNNARSNFYSHSNLPIN